MAIVMRFAARGLTAEKYDEVIRRLEDAEAVAPAGRFYHVCFGEKEDLRISEIWDSLASFEIYAEMLRPILAETGVSRVEPEIFEVHNMIAGERVSAADQT